MKNSIYIEIKGSKNTFIWLRDGVKVVHVHHPSGQKCKIFPKGPPYVLGRSSKFFRAFGAIKFLGLVWSIVIFMFN